MLERVLIKVNRWLTFSSDAWTPKINRANHNTVDPYFAPWEPACHSEGTLGVVSSFA